MPTTAAVNAIGSHDCAVLRMISLIISPTVSPGEDSRPGTQAELEAGATARAVKAASPVATIAHPRAQESGRKATVQGLG